ncbi:MAG: cytochrome-c peroxidase [Oceanicaulis sp.]
MRITILLTLIGAALVGLVWSALSSAQSSAPPGQALGCGTQVCAQGAALRPVYEGAPDGWPEAHLDADIDYVELGALPRPEFDFDDPLIILGRDLFDEPRLSATGQFACSSCHARDMKFIDGLRSSFGHDRQQGDRNAPTLLDKADQPIFHWDGSAQSLTHQAMMPIVNPIEMAADRETVETRLNADAAYRDRFEAVFGTDSIKLEQVADALAAFQASLHRTSDFDRFMQGDADRLTDQQVLGLHLFRTEARCANCHMGPRLTDDAFHNLGLHFYGRDREDLGRYEITGDPADVGAFKTPSLRHVDDTAPYMHNGLIPTLRGAINLYDHGGARPRPREEFADDPLFPETSERLHELELTQDEKDALEAFLRAL